MFQTNHANVDRAFDSDAIILNNSQKASYCIILIVSLQSRIKKDPSLFNSTDFKKFFLKGRMSIVENVITFFPKEDTDHLLSR